MGVALKFDVADADGGRDGRQGRRRESAAQVRRTEARRVRGELVGHAARRGPKLEEGVTLVEVIIAMFILSVALLMMASVGTNSLISLRMTRDREQATNAASAAIEVARARDFGNLSVATGTDPDTLPATVRTALDISGGCAGTEPIIQDPGSTDPVPLEQAAGNNGVVTVYTVVTWANEACAATSGELKRVTTLATWLDAGELLSVRNETFVAPAGRGLPVPRFEVKPSDATVTLTPAQADVGTERCVEHQLRNLGASDTYEWRIESVTGGTGASTPIDGSRRSVGGSWTVRAFLEAPAVAPRGGTPPPEVGVTDALMNDLDGNGRPESESRLEARDQATLNFCYTPSSAGAAELGVTIDILSRYDERRLQQVSHGVSIADGLVRLHLQDRDDTQAHVRQAANGSDAKKYPAYRMNPLNPASGDRSQTLATTLRPWGQELYVDAPGLPLRREVVGSESPRLRTVDFRYGVPAPTTLLPGGELRLWTAPVTHVPSSTVPTIVQILVELDVLDDKETTRLWPTADAPYWERLRYEHNGAGFRESVIPLDFAAGLNLEVNQRLRLRLTCEGASGVDCLIAYDSSAYPSHLRLAFQ